MLNLKGGDKMPRTKKSMKISKPKRDCSLKGIAREYKRLKSISDVGSLPTGNKTVDNFFNMTYNRLVNSAPISPLWKVGLKEAPKIQEHVAKATRLKKAYDESCYEQKFKF